MPWCFGSGPRGPRVRIVLALWARGTDLLALGAPGPNGLGPRRYSNGRAEGLQVTMASRQPQEVSYLGVKALCARRGVLVGSIGTALASRRRREPRGRRPVGVRGGGGAGGFPRRLPKECGEKSFRAQAPDLGFDLDFDLDLVSGHLRTSKGPDVR